MYLYLNNRTYVSDLGQSHRVERNTPGPCECYNSIQFYFIYTVCVTMKEERGRGGGGEERREEVRGDEMRRCGAKGRREEGKEEEVRVEERRRRGGKEGDGRGGEGEGR